MYLAKKRCRFAGRTFNTDEAIPEGYVHNAAAPRLISMGVIAEAPGDSLLPPKPSIEEPQEANETGENDLEELMKHKRDELVQMAEQYGIEVMEGYTKKELSEAILNAKKAAPEA